MGLVEWAKSPWGQDVPIHITLTPQSIGALPPGGMVHVSGCDLPVNGYPLTCIAHGLSTGPHVLVATYDGDSNYEGGTSAPFTHNVRRGGTSTGARCAIIARNLRHGFMPAVLRVRTV